MAVIITEWDQFRALDLERVKGLMRRPVVIDLRNIYQPDEMRELGFSYDSVGRRAVRQTEVQRQRSPAVVER